MNIFDPVLTPQNPAPRPEEPALLSMVQVPGPVILAPVPVPQDTYTPLEFAAITITIASAATIGSNIADVQNGTMSKTQAVVNGLAGTGYLIDKIMKKGPDTLCAPGKTEAS